MQPWKQRQAVQIGRNIRERRKLLGLTQSDLAQGLFSVQSISLIERGKLNVSSETLTKLAERLQCQEEDLLRMHDLHEDWLDELLQQALRCHEKHQSDEAVEVLHTLYSEALAKNNTKYLLESSYRLCSLYNQTTKYSVSLKWGQEALKYLEPEQCIDTYLNLTIIIGNNYYSLGKMWEAYDLLREAETFIGNTLNSSVQAGRLFFNMAIIKQMLNNWEGCIWYSERALQILDQKDMFILIGRTHMMMGTSYKNQGRFDKAAYHLDRSIRILSQTSDARSLARCYHNQGELELKMMQLDKARKSFLRSLKLKRQSKDYDSLQNTLRALAKVSVLQNRHEDAHHFLSECLERAERLDNKLQFAMTWRYVGDLALAEGDNEAFIKYYKQAIEQYEQLEFSTDLAEAAEKLGEYYLQQGHELLAVPYLRLATRHYRKLLKQS